MSRQRNTLSLAIINIPEDSEPERERDSRMNVSSLVVESLIVGEGGSESMAMGSRAGECFKERGRLCN